VFKMCMANSVMTDDAFVTTGSYPTRQGNHLQLLLDGEAAFRRVCEAIEQGEHQVWAAITFMWPGFEFPDGRGAPLAFLDRAAARDIDIRLLFWRPDDETSNLRANAFWGTPEHFEQLQALHPNISVRWDRAHPGYCQHQKLWLVDPGMDGQVAFLGGLNLNPHSLARPGHHGAGQNHDLYVELHGPAVADVQHNFVQRWNEASERLEQGGQWGTNGTADLPFPTQLPTECGQAVVQIQRTIHPGRYHHGAAPVGGQPSTVADGERTIIAQYGQAIRRAQRTIYMENQYVEVPEITEALHGALQRGVEVVLILPTQPDISATAYESPDRKAFFESRAALASSPNFTLAGLAGVDDAGTRHPVWIHSKVMLIDDAWGTAGSANLHRFSAFGNGELNAAFWSPETARAFRIELLAEHLGMDTSGLDDVAALRLLRRTALENRAKLESGDPAWTGIVVALDVAGYGVSPPIDFT
jgi:cardiolipin synthase A/B